MDLVRFVLSLLIVVLAVSALANLGNDQPGLCTLFEACALERFGTKISS